MVNLTSIAGSRVHPFAGSAYATSKAALAALTREMALTSPRPGCGSTPSRPARSTRGSCRPERTRSSIATSRCIGSGTIQEVADLIWFLCSPQATYVTGAEIPINGGQHV